MHMLCLSQYVSAIFFSLSLHLYSNANNYDINLIYIKRYQSFKKYIYLFICLSVCVYTSIRIEEKRKKT